MSGKFDQCSAECRRKATHTKVWGLCKKGVRPEPYVLVPREADVDGEISTEWVQVPARNLVPWLIHLPLGEQIDCLSEIATVADEDRPPVVYSWKATAHIQADPELREALTRPFDIEEYQDAPRPQEPEVYEPHIDHDLRRRIQMVARYIGNHDDPMCAKGHQSRAEEERCDFNTEVRYRKLRELIDLYFGEGPSAPLMREKTSSGLPVTEDVIDGAAERAGVGEELDATLAEFDAMMAEGEPVDVVTFNQAASRPRQVQAPFTAQQVLSINAYQLSGKMHPFTCPYQRATHVTMLATPEGMICPECGAKQHWVHDFMANWPADEEIDIQIQPAEEVTITVKDAARIFGFPEEGVLHLLENGKIEEVEAFEIGGRRRLTLESVLRYKFELDKADTQRAEDAGALDDDLGDEPREKTSRIRIDRLLGSTFSDVREKVGQIEEAFRDHPGVVKLTRVAVGAMEELRLYMATTGLSVAEQFATLLNAAGDLGVAFHVDEEGYFYVEFEVGDETRRLYVRQGETSYVVVPK